MNMLAAVFPSFTVSTCECEHKSLFDSQLNKQLFFFLFHISIYIHNTSNSMTWWSQLDRQNEAATKPKGKKRTQIEETIWSLKFIESYAHSQPKSLIFISKKKNKSYERGIQAQSTLALTYMYTHPPHTLTHDKMKSIKRNSWQLNGFLA